MLVETAERLARIAAASADEIERAQKLPDSLHAQMVEAQLFQLYLRPEAGGPAYDPLTAYLAVEALARGDASTAWLSMVSSTTGWITGFLTDDVLACMAGTPADLRLAGSSKPLGVAERVAGGYRVRGRWDFASGITHANWVMGGCRVVGGAPGEAAVRMMFVPKADVRVIETWSVVGMRGTGSHDVVIDDVFVPDERSAEPVGVARSASPLYSQRILRIATHGLVGAVVVGLAQAAIGDLLALGQQATSLNAIALRDRPEAQQALAEATAQLGGARAFVIDSIGEAWACVCDDRDPSQAVARARLSFAQANRVAGRVIDSMIDIIGTPMVQSTSPLQRRLRDYTVSRHFPAFDIAIHQNAGRVLFGLAPEGSGW